MKTSRKKVHYRKKEKAITAEEAGYTPAESETDEFLDEVLDQELESEELAEVGEDPRKYERDELRRQGYGDEGLDYPDLDDEEQ